MLEVSMEDDIKYIKTMGSLSYCCNTQSITRDLCEELCKKSIWEKLTNCRMFKLLSDEMLINIADLYTRAYFYIRNKTQENTNMIIIKNPTIINDVPKEFMTQEMCDLAINYMIENKHNLNIPQKYRTKKYYDYVFFNNDCLIINNIIGFD